MGRHAPSAALRPAPAARSTGPDLRVHHRAGRARAAEPCSGTRQPARSPGTPGRRCSTRRPQSSIQYRYNSPYDALDQIVYDLQHGVQRDGSGNVIPEDSSEYAGRLSEDGQYRWDGFTGNPSATAIRARTGTWDSCPRTASTAGTGPTGSRCPASGGQVSATATSDRFPTTASTAGTGATGSPSRAAVDRTRGKITSASCPTTGSGAGTATSGRPPDLTDPSASGGSSGVEPGRPVGGDRHRGQHDGADRGERAVVVLVPHRGAVLLPAGRSARAAVTSSA